MRFEGGTELIKAMADLSTRLQKNVTKQALEAAAVPMRNDISRRAPYEPGPPDIRANIVIGKARGNKTESAVAIGPAKGFFYGFYNEYGTVHQPARPFMRPAFDSGVARAIRDIASAMWTILAARGISQSSSSNTPVQSSGRFL